MVSVGERMRQLEWYALSRMLILPISRSWIVSRRAEQIYLGSPILTLAMIGTWIGTRTAQLIAAYPDLPPNLALFLGFAFLTEAAGAGLLSVAMLYFWFGFDQSSWRKRALWLFLLWGFFPFCSVLYYFFVYRKQVSEQRHRFVPSHPSRMLV